MERYLFERMMDLEGRLRLPDFLFDSYSSCYISLGLFSNTYLQLTPEGVYLLMSDQLGGSPFTDQDSFQFQRNLHTGEKLELDDIGRITIPKRLLKRAGIAAGSWVIGEAGSRTSLTPGEVSYWTLWDKQTWLEKNPSGQYSLDYGNARY